MGLYYPEQPQYILIGSKTESGTRTGVALTTSYEAETDPQTTATKTFGVGGMSRVDFAIAYTMGATESANSVEVRLEWTPDRVSFYPLVTDTTTGGTSVLAEREFQYVGTTNAGLSEMTFGVDIAYAEAMRISVKETGVASNAGSVYVEAVVSGK